MTKLIEKSPLVKGVKEIEVVRDFLTSINNLRNTNIRYKLYLTMEDSIKLLMKSLEVKSYGGTYLSPDDYKGLSKILEDK